MTAEQAAAKLKLLKLQSTGSRISQYLQEIWEQEQMSSSKKDCVGIKNTFSHFAGNAKDDCFLPQQLHWAFAACLYVTN